MITYCFALNCTILMLFRGLIVFRKDAYLKFVEIRIKSYFKNDFDLHSPINYDFHKEILIDFVKGAIITLVNKVMVSLVSLLTFNVIPLSLTLVGTWQLRHSNKEGGKTTKIVLCKKKLPKNPKNLLRLPYPKATFIVFLGFPCYQTINFDDCLKYFFRSIVRPLFPG